MRLRAYSVKLKINQGSPIVQDRYDKLSEYVSKLDSRLLRRTIGFVGTGAAGGILLALIFELTGHPWWALLMLLSCTASGGVLLLMPDLGVVIHKLRLRMPTRAKVSLIFLLIGATLAIELAMGVNPRDHAYLPLLPPILVCALLLGFGYGVLSVVICTLAADYFFSPPKYDFRITELKDLVGLSVFAILGACSALALQTIFSKDDET